MRESIEEAERWDLEHMMIKTLKATHNLKKKKKNKNVGQIWNPAGGTQESLEGKMQSANKAWWRDAKICQSKDLPWKIKCR